MTGRELAEPEITGYRAQIRELYQSYSDEQLAKRIGVAEGIDSEEYEREVERRRSRDRYAEHIQELADVIAEALRQAERYFPDFADDLYITKLDIDGQYHTVSVGVANVTDFQTIVDTTKIL